MDKSSNKSAAEVPPASALAPGAKKRKSYAEDDIEKGENSSSEDREMDTPASGRDSFKKPGQSSSNTLGDGQPNDPTISEANVWSKTVFVGSLPPSVDIEQVREFLHQAAETSYIRFATFGGKIYNELVQADFVTAEGAKKAYEELNGKHLVGWAARLYHAHERGTSSKVYCENKVVEIFTQAVYITNKFCVLMPNFAELQGMGINQRTESVTFGLGQFEWEIHFYPDGAEPGCAGCTSAFLYCASTSYPEARFSLSVLDQDNQSVYDGPELVFSPDQCQRELGYMCFVEQSRLLDMESFIIVCALTVIKRTPIEDPYNKDMTGANVMLKVGGREFYAHKSRLASQSPVFLAQFFGLMAAAKEDMSAPEDMTTIVIDDVHPDIFEMMLHFIYMDEVPWPEYESGEWYSPEVFEHLVVAADFYGLELLKQLCEYELGNRLENQTVMDRFILADLYYLHELRHTCLRFMSAGSILKTE